jgi:hypothetical protein
MINDELLLANDDLYEAVVSSNEDNVRDALERGADVNGRSDSGQTHLIRASISGSFSSRPAEGRKAFRIMKILLDAGADVNAYAIIPLRGMFVALGVPRQPRLGPNRVKTSLSVQLREDNSIKNPEIVDLLIRNGVTIPESPKYQQVLDLRDEINRRIEQNTKRTQSILVGRHHPRFPLSDDVSKMIADYHGGKKRTNKRKSRRSKKRVQ